MKKIYTLFILTCLINGGLNAQSAWDGAWHGKIEMANLRLVFNLKTAGNGSVSATMDSPDQSAFGLAVESASVKEDSLYISDSRFRISFKGKRTNDSTITGVFTQGMDIPLVLKRNSPETKSPPKAKKQTPVPPFPYKEEEVTIENKKAGITMSGTLTIPSETNGKGYPAIILISGSGPQDRDETIFGHKPFAVLADHLTRQGIMVLRYDDRGTGKSTGDFSSSTSRDFADDAEAVLKYLYSRKDVNKKQIGLIGHSEGGLIAPLVANENKEVGFIVLLAGPGIPIIDLMTEQNVAIMRSQGLAEAAANAYGSLYKDVMLIARNNDIHEEKKNAIIKVAEGWERSQSAETLKLLGIEDDWHGKFAEEMVKGTESKWMQYFLNYDPGPELKKLKIKVLALNGEEDNQVVAKSNLAGIESSLKKSKSPSFKTVSLKGLNHLFQQCTTCTIEEYGSLEETFSPTALSEITSWLAKEGIIKR